MKDAYGYVGDKARKVNNYLPKNQQDKLCYLILYWGKRKATEWMKELEKKKKRLGFRRSVYSMEGEPLRIKASRELMQTPTLV